MATIGKDLPLELGGKGLLDLTQVAVVPGDAQVRQHQRRKR